MTSRRDFLAAGALAALGPTTALAASPKPSLTPKAGTSSNDIPKLDFDLAAFDASLDRTVKHKHIFSSVKIDGAAVFGAMRNTLKAYGDIGTPATEVLPVAVLYHGASIALAFDDSVWADYFLPLLREKGSTKHPEMGADFATIVTSATTGNPCMTRSGGEWDDSIPSLVADSGAHFYVCNNATRGFADAIGKAKKVPAPKVYRDLARHLVPNAMLVPAGVWAVNAIAERGFTLLQTSL